MFKQSETAESILDITEDNKPDEVALLESEKYWNSQNDPLQAYLRDVRRYPSLTEREKQRLLKKYRSLGDQEARKMLIVSNLRLVMKIAFRYNNYTHLPPSDLIQEGNLGLMRAVEKNDPAKRAKFSYYASFWIRARIMNHIRKNWRLIKTITTENKRKLFAQLKREKRKLAEADIEPDTERIADNLNVEVKDVSDMEKIMADNELSLDQPLPSEEGNRPRIDFIPSKINTEELVFEKEIKEKGRAIFARFRKTLSPKELFVFDNRLCCEEALTLEELGDKLKLSRERVRQIEKAVYQKLHRFNKPKENKRVKASPDQKKKMTPTRTTRGSPYPSLPKKDQKN